MDDENTQEKVRCTLCGSTCVFDKQQEWLFFRFVLIVLGVFMLMVPEAWVDPLSFICAVGDTIAYLVGIILWTLLMTATFNHPPQWICTRCGACFRAIRLYTGTSLQSPPKTDENHADTDD